MGIVAKSLLSAGFSVLMAGYAIAAPDVVVSIKPVHSLVASIMKNVGEPSLIVQGSATPHAYQLRPSQAAALEDADVIFWTGHGLEAFLEKPLETLGSKARIVALEDAPGLTRLGFREGGAFDRHGHGDHAAEGQNDAHVAEADGHDDHGLFDMHVWLDTDNAKAMAREIARTLSEADPANKSAYEANLVDLSARLDTLASEIETIVAPVKDQPSIVFHDAYQYFEHRFGVRVAGSITVSPEVAPGAERLTEIRARIKDLKATCVFAEPQFEPKVVSMLVAGTAAKTGVLDPEGASLEPGADLYFELMRAIANNLKACLAQG